jgi:SAM-dependent methyltransferase
MNEIEHILSLVPTKLEYKSTTSKQFKLDVYEYFNKPEFKTLNCLEIGCAKGHTTLILSKLFNKVYGVNEDSCDIASEFCKSNGSLNAEFFVQDVYRFGFPNVEADIIMIDAIHTYEHVYTDIKNSLKLKSKNKKYFIFDDMGLFPEVNKVVKDMCDQNVLRFIKDIGVSPDGQFHKPLNRYEGAICVEI